MQAPLPAYSFGQIAISRPNVPRPLRPGVRIVHELLETLLCTELAWSMKAKLLEAALRGSTIAELPAVARFFATSWREQGHSSKELCDLFRELFNAVSLSPWTDFVEKTLTLLDLLQENQLLAPTEVVDFLGYLLRQIGRHLTAYDLVTFHHRGGKLS